MPGFSLLDWSLLVAFLVLSTGVGLGAARGSRGSVVRAEGGVPWWAAALSVFATAFSAATFIGGPQQAYTGNLTYFVANAGGLIAVLLVAAVFVPALTRQGVVSVYELLTERFGLRVRRVASAMFMAGRIMANGARLFMVALPFALVAWGEASTGTMLFSIAVVTVVGATYTIAGGLRAVVWTDVLQTGVILFSVGGALVVLLQKIDMPVGEIIDHLRSAPGGDKLRLLDWSPSLASPWTVPATIFGWSLLNLAAFGTDQDFAQRLMVCRSKRAAQWSIIASNLIGWPVVFAFLMIGVLLYAYYTGPGTAATAPEDSRQIFVHFILHEMPSGMKGLMMAGLFAAALSTLVSTLSALSAATLGDFVHPWLARHGRRADERFDRRAGRALVAAWALIVGSFAVVCIFWQDATGQTLLEFALGVMVFAYTGLLGVFLVALRTRRGSPASGLCALVTGPLVVIAIKYAGSAAAPEALRLEHAVATPWLMLFGTAASALVALCGTPRAASAA